MWIEISVVSFNSRTVYCHSLRGSVDWNVNYPKPVNTNLVTPCVGVWIEISQSSCQFLTTRSLPAWECGLKSSDPFCTVNTPESLPAWECGLKYLNPVVNFWQRGHSLRGSVDWNSVFWSAVILVSVTPCVGVWIEIKGSNSICADKYVTPCVGVWIEIRDYQVKINQDMSLPAWECGLKCNLNGLFLSSIPSLPAWECGLKS